MFDKIENQGAFYFRFRSLKISILLSIPAVCQDFEEPEVSCLAYIPRWRYVSSIGQCENFIFGGCGGNANNFETFEACERKCMTPVRGNPVDNTINRNRATTWMGL